MRNQRYINKIILFSVFFLLIGTSLIADNSNILQIHDAVSEPFDTITVDVEIINDDSFVAFQFDLPLSEQLTYLPNSTQLTIRSVDHIIIANIVNNDTLRIFAYSPTNTAFTGNSGNVAYFELIVGSVPGNYSLNMNSPIIGDSNSVNILTGTINGIFTILAPDIDLNTDSLDFDRTPLGSYTDRTFTIYNLGNQSLQVDDINIDNPYFTIVGDTTFTISAFGEQTITVRFNSIIKGTYNNQLTIISNDPDEPNLTIQLHAIAFAVNELHIGNIFAFSGDTVRLYCSINNMEPFVGFQFDLLLPEPMTYIEGTTQLTERAVDHIVSANMIGEDTLRVVAYSPSNTPFLGIDGDIVFMDFYIVGTGGYYSLNAENVIIGDAAGDNILSDYFNGQLEIAAADIYGPGSLNFGEISLLDTLQLLLNIGNNGNDTLLIDQIVFTDTSFWSTIALPQSIIPSQQLSISVFFSNILEGTYQGLMRIYSNDPDESPFDVTLQGISFSPNYMIVRDTTAFAGDTVLVKIDVDNYDEFVAFQFDLNFSEMLTFIDDSAELTDRAQDHILVESLLDSTNLRIIVYSMSQSPFIGNSGTVLTIQFIVNENCPSANLALTLSNAILGDANSNNILRDVQDGEVVVVVPVTHNISGSISYFSFWDAVPNVILELTGDSTYSTSTDEIGDYFFWEIFEGNYESTPSKTDDLGGLGGTDASRVARYSALLYGFDCLEMIAADVSMNGFISGTDASRVARYVALLITELNPEGIDWVFTPEPIPECNDWPPIVYENTREYSPLDSDLTDEDFIGIRLGDVSGNWSPDVRMPLTQQSSPPGADPSEEVTEIEASINSTLKIPVVIDELTAIEGIDIAIIFDPEVLQLTGLSINEGILDKKDYVIETNLEEAGKGRMVIYAQKDLVSESGVVAFIDFDVIGVEGSKTEVYFIKFDLNETEASGGLQVIDSEGNEVITRRLEVNVIQPLPEKFALYSNYPNPFNSKTVIRYDLPKDTYVSIQIYNVRGQLVKELVNGVEEAGRKQIEWDVKDMSSGIYFYKLLTKDKIFIKKMLLLH
ncbi:MAG: choice-of-anchor D domain-containing protein [Candidatus Cloacimonetes bacterium]|nr:choice-of-anchor D domain-containing protein [Candidatus Cloacimonadota bacterium]